MNTSGHVPRSLLGQYAAGDPAIPAEVLWPIEVHLERCARCREDLGRAVVTGGAGVTALLARVWAGVETELAGGPRAPVRRHRRVGRWAPPGLGPRLALTMLVLGAAVALDLAGGSRVLPPLVLLVAPVAPLLGVAAAWSGLDPVYEVVVASPRAGLQLVLRRTLAVLVAVIPALAVAGWLAGASPAAWLLPCLAFTAGALALGELIGVRRAASVLALAWTAVVVTPSVLTARTPVVLQSPSLPYWAGLIAVVAIALLRRDAYTGLRSDAWSVR